jgi:hypothetical protein
MIALQLIVRIADYKYIQQRNHPLCGPVSFMHDIARRDPKQYAQYVIDLAQTRQGSIGNLAVTVSVDSGLLNRHANPAHIKEADYIALASLRDADNVFAYRSAVTNRTMEGASMPGDIVKWMTAAGYTNVQDQSHTLWRMCGLLLKSDRVAYATTKCSPACS